MKYELNESVKTQLIQILNSNIKLQEAKDASSGIPPTEEKKKKEEEESSEKKELPNNSTSSSASNQSGQGMPSPEKQKPDKSWHEILLGNQELKTPWGTKMGLGDVATIAAGGKLAGGVGRFFGGSLAQGASNLLGGSKRSAAMGGALGNLFGKVTSDLETLSGAPSMEAQVGDIAPHQLSLRWEGSGTHGWFRPLVPRTETEKFKPKTSTEISDLQLSDLKRRLDLAKTTTQAQKLGIFP